MSNGLNKTTKPTIGILMELNEKWMGGVNYIINLIKVLSFAPVEQLPRIVLLAREDVPDYFRILVEKSVFLEIHYLKRCNPPAELKGEELYSTIWRHRSSQVKQAIEKLSIDFLFPVIDPRDLDMPTAIIGWIPDFQHKYMPDFFQESEILARNSTYTQFANKAEFMLFSSNATLQDFRKFYPQFKSRNFVYHFCTVLDQNRSMQPINYLQNKYGLSENFFYLPNQFWAHKNHRTVFETIYALKQTGCQIELVCTGTTFDYRNVNYVNQLMNYKDEMGLDNIKVLGLIPAEDQAQLYYHTKAVIQPSLFEGWSSIVEDARAFNKRIILSDIPVHREQNPERAIYFDPTNKNDLIEKIRLVLDESISTELYQDLIEKQAGYVKQTAASLLKIFDSLI